MERKLLFAALAVVLAGGAGYYFWHLGAPAPAPVERPAPVPPPPPPPAPEHYPVAPRTEPLPALADSDGPFARQLAEALGVKVLPAWVYPEQMIQRFVATVDNLPRARVSTRTMPVQPVPGPFRVTGSDKSLAIDPGNAARYRLYLTLAEQADRAALVELYRRWYPLFQQAYVELGYPKGYFNDRLVAAINDMLAAPEAPARVALTQPHVLYEYADPDLEGLSAGQKIMLRMGNENAARMKLLLRDIRTRLAEGGSAG